MKFDQIYVIFYLINNKYIDKYVNMKRIFCSCKNNFLLLFFLKAEIFSFLSTT